jgi:hypothetical protein
MGVPTPNHLPALYGHVHNLTVRVQGEIVPLKILEKQTHFILLHLNHPVSDHSQEAIFLCKITFKYDTW